MMTRVGGLSVVGQTQHSSVTVWRGNFAPKNGHVSKLDLVPIAAVCALGFPILQKPFSERDLKREMSHHTGLC
jgi:hypothetical protein